MESAPNIGDQSAVSLLRDSRNHVVFIVLYPNRTAQTQTLRLSIWRMHFLMRFAVKTEPYPGRWTYHIVIGTPDELDETLFDWIGQAYTFSENK